MLSSLLLSGLLVLVGYLLGSLPTGYLVARWLKGIDIREYGSGSTGATNVLRTVGKTAAIAVLIIDLLKGAIALLLVKAVPFFIPETLIRESWIPWLVLGAALAAVLGHSKSIWLNFTGGKSVATSLGVLLVMSPPVALGALGIFLIVLAASRIVSLSSISAAVGVSISMLVFNQPVPYLIFGGLGGIYVILRHRSNIDRILKGTESKLGQTVPTSEEAQEAQ